LNEDKQLVEMEIDGVKFQLKKATDFSFLNSFGEVFCVFDQTDSGNISFGVQNHSTCERFFIKVAGASTAESFRSPEQAIQSLKDTVKIYKKIQFKNLIDFITAGEFNELFYTVFRWSEGECLFDHWNFKYYQKHPEVLTPRQKFNNLKTSKKMHVAEQILNFMEEVENANYVAVDFYDGSLMYDFEKDNLTICDIDFFRQMPTVNDIGEDYWGTKRMKAPEEYKLGGSIDTRTNVFIIGALFFNIFGYYTSETLAKMYEEKRFIPLEKHKWELPSPLYDIALKAVASNPDNRYKNVRQLKNKWMSVCNLL